MKSSRQAIAIAAGATLLAITAPASARVLVATWTGTITSGYDATGFFGTVGDLTGFTYVAQYTYDTSVGYRDTSLPDYDEVYGGSVYSLASPVSATLTVNGHIASSNGDYYSLADTAPSSTLRQDDARQEDTTATGYHEVSIYNYSYFVSEPTLETPLPLYEIPGRSFGVFHLEDDNNFSGNLLDITAYATADTLQVTSSVPEPAAWTLMFLGVGIVGGIARRGKGRMAVY